MKIKAVLGTIFPLIIILLLVFVLFKNKLHKFFTMENDPIEKIIVVNNETNTNRENNLSEVFNDKRRNNPKLYSLLKDYSPCDGFDFPVGKPDAKKYYNAQKFGKNNHLGEDWNGIKGGNTDLGDPIYSIADGYVYYSQNVGGGWGKIIRIIHKYKDKSQIKYVESFYAHFKDMLVKKGMSVKRGQKIGTMGNVGGQYYAHLHFELRQFVGMPILGGYSDDITGFLNPTQFIKKNRPKRK